jgi:hypothetical protein
MRRSSTVLVALLVAAVLAVTLTGCGGGGGSTGTTPTVSGAATGKVQGASAASFKLVLDGHTLTAAPSANGAFTIPDLPPGNHNLAVVGAGGMVGAHCAFVVTSGQTVNLGDIAPTEGGQIAGMVSSVDDQGNLTPRAGVTVMADPNPIYYGDGGGVVGGGTGSGGTGTGGPITPQSRGVAKQADTVALTAVTAANGSYLIPAVAAGGYVVTVNVPGLEQGVSYAYVSAGQTSACDFKLKTAVQPGVGTVSGTVLGQIPSGASPPPGTPTTAPLVGAWVSISTDTPWQPIGPPIPMPLPTPLMGMPSMPPGAISIMPPLYRFNTFTTLTDQSGHYALNVPSGHLTITVWAENYAPADEAFTLQPDETQTKDFTLSWGGMPVPLAPPTTAKGK